MYECRYLQEVYIHAHIYRYFIYNYQKSKVGTKHSQIGRKKKSLFIDRGAESEDQKSRITPAISLDNKRKST